jgi:hypothetical protein
MEEKRQSASGVASADETSRRRGSSAGRRARVELGDEGCNGRASEQADRSNSTLHREHG